MNRVKLLLQFESKICHLYNKKYTSCSYLNDLRTYHSDHVQCVLLLYLSALISLSWFLCFFCGLPGLTLTVSVCKKITSQLISAMGKQDDVSVQLEALDILSDMLGR